MKHHHPAAGQWNRLPVRTGRVLLGLPVAVAVTPPHATFGYRHTTALPLGYTYAAASTRRGAETWRSRHDHHTLAARQGSLHEEGRSSCLRISLILPKHSCFLLSRSD